LTDPDTGEVVEGWSPDDTVPALGPTVVYSMTPEEELAFPDALVDALNHRDDPPLTVPERSAAANAALRAAGLYNGPDGFHDKTAELAAWRSLPTAEEELRWTVENDTYPPRVAAADEALRKRETPEQTTLRKLEEWRKKDEERRAAEAEAQAGKPRMDATAAAVVPQDDVYDSDAFMPVGDFRNQLASKHGGTDCNIWTKIKRKNPWIRFDLQAPTSRPRIHRADAAKLLDRLDVNTWELLDEGEHPSIAGEALDEQIADAIATRRAIREVKRRKGG
jgi:hypothetical protein